MTGVPSGKLIPISPVLFSILAAHLQLPAMTAAVAQTPKSATCDCGSLEGQWKVVKNMY